MPSPTWPTIGATNRLSAMSRWVSPRIAASREIGHAHRRWRRQRRPGRSERAAQWHHGAPAELAADPPAGSPTRTVHHRAPPQISPKRCDCSATPASLPVEFEEQHRASPAAPASIGVAGPDPAAHRRSSMRRDRNAGLDGRIVARSRPRRSETGHTPPLWPRGCQTNRSVSSVMTPACPPSQRSAA